MGLFTPIQSLLGLANTWASNQTFSGTANTAPNQTAASASSLITRSLSDTRFLEYATRLHTYPFSLSNFALKTNSGSFSLDYSSTPSAYGSTSSTAGSYSLVIPVYTQPPLNRGTGSYIDTRYSFSVSALVSYNWQSSANTQLRLMIGTGATNNGGGWSGSPPYTPNAVGVGVYCVAGNATAYYHNGTTLSTNVTALPSGSGWGDGSVGTIKIDCSGGTTPSITIYMRAIDPFSSIRPWIVIGTFSTTSFSTGTAALAVGTINNGTTGETQGWMCQPINWVDTSGLSSL
jgi:hypothetical protein